MNQLKRKFNKVGMNWNTNVFINYRTDFRIKQITFHPIYSVTISETYTVIYLAVPPFSVSSSCFLLRRNLSAWIMHLSPRMFLTPQPFLEGMDLNFPFRNVIDNLLTHEYFWETLASLSSSLGSRFTGRSRAVGRKVLLHFSNC